MSDVKPPSSIPTSVPPKAGPTSLATITSSPPAIAKLASGTMIVGTVLRQDQSGQTLLRTEHGQLALTTRLILPAGAEVKLEVRAVGARLQAIVLSVEGRQPVSGGAAPLSAAAQPPLPVGGGGGSPPASGIPQPQAPLLAQPGPPGGASVGIGRNTERVAIVATLVSETAKSDTPSAAVSLLKTAARQEIPVRLAILSLLMPGGGAAAPMPAVPLTTAASGGTILSGTVLGTNSQGQPILQTPLGQLTLPIRAELPIGVVLTFELLEPPSSRPAAEAISRIALPLAAEWAALKETLQILGKTNPALQAILLNVTIPRIGTDMAAKLLHYFSALVKGNIRDWLGERLLHDLEQVNKGALAQRLSDEFLQISRLALRGEEDWRTMLFPILYGNNLHQAKLFLRHHDSRHGGEERNGGTRIIVEVSLSRLGDLQLDGLYHGRHFDLILRTRHPLPVFMTTEIRSIFGSCCENSALQGNLMFRANEPFVTTPLRESPTAGLGLEV